MSDAPGDPLLGEPPPAAATAGGLLKQARLARGLHIAALATSIKVAPKKLELLEADRFDELPGATFTRALAQTVCRTLKIDPAPVLALLPQPADQGLSQMSLGLNAPFRDKPGRRVPSDFQFLRNPIVLGAGVLVLASVLVYLLPAGWVSDITPRGASEPGGRPAPPVAEQQPALFPPATSASTPAPSFAPAGSAVEVATANVVSPASEPTQPAANAAIAAPAAPSGALLVRASAQSWVEVIDGQGNTLLSRLLEGGETVGLDGPSPLRVRIGNASATEVSFRGRAVELTPTRDNVAKLELR
ncbi:MAG: helix-turn-helix domain-containing protein [Rhizobacter sp.]|nr:helix-turn-helix domain-containing protein [Rhizobacter sp.]